MLTTDYELLCELFYNSRDIPIRCYSDDRILLIQYPLIEEEMDAFSQAIDEFYPMNNTVLFSISNHHLYFGCIRDQQTGNYILIGPVSSEPCSDNEVCTIMEEAFVSPKYYEILIQHLSLIPCMELKHFISTLAYLHYQINDFYIPDDDIYPLDNVEVEETKQINHQIVTDSFKGRDEKTNAFVYSYSIEQKYLYLIGSGNVDALNHLIFTNTLYIPEVNSSNTLRNNKNIMIQQISLASRCAIQNGLEVDTAFQLCETYTKLIEQSQNLDIMYRHLYDSFTDFAKRVSKSKIPKETSPLVSKCIHFIGNSVNSPITVGDVADHVGRSKAYVSTKFKNEMGCNLGSYITLRKIDEAKSLLCFTNKSISEISNYLCFSSQSYFQNVFKKVTKQTPQKYREKENRL